MGFALKPSVRTDSQLTAAHIDLIGARGCQDEWVESDGLRYGVIAGRDSLSFGALPICQHQGDRFVFGFVLDSIGLQNQVPEHGHGSLKMASAFLGAVQQVPEAGQADVLDGVCFGVAAPQTKGNLFHPSD